jgi:internalin A
MQPDRDRVFIYYSHEDDKWRRRIQTALTPLLRDGVVKAWDDKQILAGTDWYREIKQALSRARVGVLLVSPDALASGFIMRDEWPALEAAAQHGELRLLWILVRACLWEHTSLARYQAALDPKQPLSAMSPSTQDAAIVEICRQIERAFRASDPLLPR